MQQTDLENPGESTKYESIRYDLTTPVMKEDPIDNTSLIEIGFIDKKKRVKVFEKECPSYQHIMVYDIKASGNKFEEDKIYSSSPDLQYNLRKGHTIVEVYDPDNFENK